MVELVEALRPAVGWLVGGMLVVASLLTLLRIAKGPSVLNRTLASDVLVTTLLCGIAAEATLSRHGSTIPIMVSLSLVAFVGSVSVSRFVARDTDPAEPLEQAEEVTDPLATDEDTLGPQADPGAELAPGIEPETEEER